MNNISEIKLIECPRDAMQGLHDFVPTKLKAEYINSLLQVGFDTLDFGSFVSPKAIPQMRDTAEVISKLDKGNSDTKLLSIIANERGAYDAVKYDEITYLGFPFSVSPTFQQRNTNASQEEAIERIKKIQDLCLKHNKKLVVYLSMAFGNPYGEEWSIESIAPWVEKFDKIDIPIISLADTVGVAKKETITTLFEDLIPKYENIEFGAHFHSRPDEWEEKINAAYHAGCKRFDSTINGIGGCPMAKDELVGNIATENLLFYFKEKVGNLATDPFLESQRIAEQIFNI